MAKHTSLIRRPFCQFQIVFGSKAAVKAHLERITLVDLFLTIEHWDGQIHIGWIAALNNAIEYQIGGTACQTNLVPIDCISPILDNDVGMRLKDGDNLFLEQGLFPPSGHAAEFGISLLR